jgi:thiol-disulfide isomerase/thioredoxin
MYALPLLAALAAFSVPQQGTPPKTTEAPAVLIRPFTLDQRVDEELHLPDLDGKVHALFAENPNQALVLVFWSYRDPISLGYVPKLAALAKTYEGKAAFYLVDSNLDELVSAGDPVAKIKDVLAREKITLRLLIDKDNRVADDFRALTNGQTFLIDGNKYLRYHGGVDDDPRGERLKAKTPVTTWLEDALKPVLAGKHPELNWTQAAGRPIKRAPKGAPAKPK